MSVVEKALDLLCYFSTPRPEIGLSTFSRLANRDKATTYRHLTALEDAGFVEKNPITGAYRIGPAVLHLARMRELTVPRKEGALEPLRTLADATGETAHVSVFSANALHALEYCESDRYSTRAVIDIQILPLHATASGICALAFGPSELTVTAMNALTPFTTHTAANKESLNTAIAKARETGFGVSDRGFEDDVYGVAAALFDQTGLFAGSVAVASVASRITASIERQIKRHLIKASHDISRNWGGFVPDQIEACWARHLPDLEEWENAS